MTNEAIQNREPFLQNLREKLGVEKQPVSAHPFEPINHLPEEQLADKTSAAVSYTHLTLPTILLV